LPATVRYKAAAEAEIGEIFAYLDSQRRGLGVEFLNEIERVESFLRDNPAIYQQIDNVIRRAVLRRFPYGLFYVVDDGEVSVIACFHLHRGPRSYQELLSR
jgi:plasmid stabilization system protein ParE